MGTGRYIRISVCLLFAPAVSRLSWSQVPGLSTSTPPAATKPAENDPLGRDTPYSCVVGFLKAAERGDYARAAEYLTVEPSVDASQLARELQAILNVERVVDLEKLSRSPGGGLQDGLPGVRERVGTIDAGDGSLEILLNRVQRAGQPAIWLFSPETLRRVPGVYRQIEVVGIESFVPRPLREIRFFSLPLYRWLGTLLGLFIVLGLAELLSRLMKPLFRPLLRRITRDQGSLQVSRGPLRLVLLAAGFRTLAAFSVTVLGRQLWTNLAMAIALIGVAWLLMRFANIVAEVMGRRLTERQMTGKLAVVALARRLFKIGVAIAAVVALVYSTGRDVTAILAGVGLGGIALALAAQKTLENLFGGISLISDEPIRVGDFCRLADKVGTVEDIGLRSTRLRTPDRTVLSIPNGQLAGMNIENFSLRDKFLFRQKIGLRYETTPSQLRGILAGINEMLNQDPSIDPQDARVRLMEFGESAFLIEIFAHVVASDYLPFLEKQEELLLGVLDIIVAGGSGLAFPSRTMYLTQDKTSDPALLEQAAARTQPRERVPAPATRRSA